MTMQRLLITRYGNGIATSMFQDQELLQVHIEKEQDVSLLENIYVGKVKNIVKNINAAFVEIENGQMCYLPISEKETPIFCNSKNSDKICIGDELLVQISKDAIKTKSPSVTTKIQFVGKYCVVTYGDKRIGVSGKLKDPEQRQNWVKKIKEFLPKDHCFGVVVRTNAINCEEGQLFAELEVLQKLMLQIVETGKYKSCFSKIYQAPLGYLCDIRDGYDESIEEIVTDDKEIYDTIHAYLLNFQPSDVAKLVFYNDSMLTLNHLYGIETKIEKALQEKVWLNSGGYLIIQPTEAMNVIDVNSGKAIAGKKNTERHFLKINLEAAVEIAKQIRLRNISGIIIIDFIDMDEEASKKELIETLEREIKKDSVKTVFVDMTKLNLVELTRKKMRKSLAEQVKELK